MLANDARTSKPSIDDERMTRRGLLGGMFALSLPSLPSMSDQPDPGPASAFWGNQIGDLPVYATEVWTDSQWNALEDKPADAQRLEGVGWVLLRNVPRWESLAGDPVPQPEPLEKEIIFKQYVRRLWRPEDVHHCRLCVRCNACGYGPKPDLMMCHTEIA